jgi:hypothetical protein
VNLDDLLERLHVGAETWIGTPIGGLLADAHQAIQTLRTEDERG